MKFTDKLLMALLLIMLSLPSFSQPTLIAPANGATCIDTSARFDWQIYPNTLGYELSISTSADMSNPLVFNSPGGNPPTLDVELPAHDQTYYWTITAHLNDPPDFTVSVSTTWSFRTVKLPPKHVQPIAGNSCVSKSYLFKWRKITNATYHLQLSLVSTFNTIIEERINLTDTTALLTLPEYNQKYFWRILANYDGCVTKFSKPDSFVTQRQPATLVSPANKTHSVSRTAGLKLSWSSVVAPTNYILQVATDSIFSNIVHEYIGTNTNDSVYNSLQYNFDYFWRVRMDYSGCTTEWTPFRRFRVEYEKPKNLIPKEDSICVPLSLRFKWDGVDGAVTYRVQLSERDDFTSLVLDSTNININYMNYNLKKNETAYYWRVKAQDANNTSVWSDPSWLRTAIGFPTRVSPVSGTQKLAKTVLFKWQKPSPYTYDRLQVANDPEFSSIVYDKRALPFDSIYLTMPDQFATYYWRVQSDLNLCVSVWSSAWSFNTVLLPPVLNYPKNNETGQSLALTLEWKPSEGAKTYEFALSTDPNFTTIVTGKTGVPVTKIYINNLLPNTNYYWRVNSSNERGTSDWSQTFTFKTASEPLDVPVQIAPLPGESKLPVNKVILMWNKVDRATKYGLQISENEDMSRPVISLTDHPDTTYPFTGLSYGITYYWRVMASNASASGSWSGTRGFSTLIQAPSDAPVLLKPDDKLDQSPTELTFDWEDVLRAENYELELSTDPDFTNIYQKDTNIFSSYVYFSNLNFEETFYWRVRAKNYSGKGPWSDTRSFTTLINSVDEELAKQFNASVNPNPVSGISQLSITLPSDKYLQIDLLNAAGAKIARLTESNFSGGTHMFSINSDNIDNGAYFAVIRVGLQRFTVKFIVNK